MNQLVAVAIAAAMVVSAFGASGGAALDSGGVEILHDDTSIVAQQTGDETDDGTNETEVPNQTETPNETEMPNESIAPGEQLGGVVSVGAAEFRGDLDRRGFGVALAEAETDEERARVIAAMIEHAEVRLEEMEQRQASIENRWNRSNATRGMHDARMASTYAGTRGLERVLADANATAAEIPNETLEENGVDVAKLEELQTRADELGGPDVARTAREIAGPHAGDRPGPPDDRPRGPHGGGDDDRGPGHDRDSGDDRGPGHDRGSGDDGSTDDGSTDDGESTETEN